MKVTKNRRGFDIIERDNYAEEGKSKLKKTEKFLLLWNGTLRRRRKIAVSSGK